ncbi:MAG: di-heme oxidoredictase family protein [Bacteroidota bacterium]
MNVHCSCENERESPANISAENGEELAGGDYLTTFDLSENAFGQQAQGLTTSQQADFVVGNSFFRNNWVTAPASVQSLDGLGPLMNAISCSGCHFKDGRAKPPSSATESLNGLLFRLSIPGELIHGHPAPVPAYGGQFQEKSIEGVNSEGEVSVTYTEITGAYTDGATYSLRAPTYEFRNLQYGAWGSNVMISPRIAQQIPGLGLLENVEESTILSFADENDLNGDGVSGRPNYVWDQVKQQTVLGRFGWKANQPSLLQQASAAFNGDMGITTTIFPQDALTEVQRNLYPNVPNGGAPELEDINLNKVVRYIQTLAVPGRRDWKNDNVLLGKTIFNHLGCAKCHIPKMVTSNSSEFPVLNGQTIRPYTDLLLHDMGEGLADYRPDFLATGSEWRTAPLWGLGMIKTVNRHTFLLHDGRARSIEEAILWHGGEAATSKISFEKLTYSDRNALVSFIESL